MMKVRGASIMCAAVLAALAGCSQQRTASDDVSPVVEQRVAITPESIPVAIGPLSGELSDLRVTRRIDGGTGDVVYAPQLSGTLVLRNTSKDQAVRVIGGAVHYVGEGGETIALAENRDDTAFSIPGYMSERLDPGAEVRHTIDVPFPAAAFENGLAGLRLGVDYVAMPYHTATATVDVTVGPRS